MDLSWNYGKCFFPSLPSKSEELSEFITNGGHLFTLGYKPNVPESALKGKSDIWNGNLAMLKRGTSHDEATLRDRIGLSLTVVQLFEDEEMLKWKELVPKGVQDDKLLDLRRELLQRLADSPGHAISFNDLTTEMRQFKIVEQLAAFDLVTFCSPEREDGNDDVIIVPYYSAVIQQFDAYKAARQLEVKHLEVNSRGLDRS